MPNPSGRFATMDYTTLAAVQSRLYSGQGLLGATNPPVDATRDDFIKQLIPEVSRDFDRAVWETGEYPGLFAWRLETRLYSGLGQQDLVIGPFAKLAKIEVAATPGQIMQSFQDYTVEFGQNRIGYKPIRGYPKKTLFRQSTFYVDPFRLGNVRLTGIWGIVQPDPSAVDTASGLPDEDWEDAYLDSITTNSTSYKNADVPTAPSIADLGPDGGGWWKTPDDVVNAVTSWVVHRYQTAKTGYGTSTGTGAQKFSSLKAVPDDVQRVINGYKANHDVPKMALVADDGSDVDTSGAYPVWRWAGWMTHS
jgi:hypothetical protein